MKNFINRALVAKKHLKLFFALFAMLALGVTNAWGADPSVGDVIFQEEFTVTAKTMANAYNFAGTTTWSGSTSGLSYASSSTSSYMETQTANPITSANFFFVKASESNLTMSGISIPSNTTAITVSFQSNKTIVKCTYSFDGSTYNTGATSKSGVQSFDIDCTGKSTLYLKFSKTGTSSNARIDNVIIKAKTVSSATPDPVDPTVTFSNGNYTVGGTLNLSTLWTSNSDGAVTYTVKTDGGTGATINGTSFTATVAGTCEVKASQAATSAYNAIEKTATITVTEPTPATVTLSEAGTVTNVADKNVDDAYTLPSTSTQTCGDKVFVGWSTVEIATPGDKPTSDFYEPGTTVTLSAKQTFYAVYATKEAGGGNVFDGSAGGTFKIYAVVNGTNYYAKGTGSKISSTTNEGEATEYTFTKISDGVFSIKTSSTYITYASSSNLGTNNTTAYNWNISTGTNGTWRIASVATNTRGFIYRASTYNQFGGYALSNATAGSTEYFDVEIGSGSSASYIDYTTSCGTTPEPAVKYDVKIADAITNGTVTANPTSAEEGATITLTITPADGYVLNNLSVTDESSNSISVTDNKFEMPASNVTVSATFKEIPAATLTLSKNGVEETFPGEHKVGDVITLPDFTSDCSKTFVGWDSKSNCAVAPEYAPGADFTLTAEEHTLYAVYGTQTGGGEGVLTKMTSTDAFANGDKVVIVAYGTQLGMYQETSGTSYVKYWELAGNEPTVAELDEKTIWDVEANGENWKIGDATIGYLHNASSNNLAVSTTNASTWTITWKENGFVFKSDLDRYMACRTDLTTSNKNLYRMNGTSVSNNSTYEMDVYKYTSSAPIYSEFSTTCSAAPDAPVFSVGTGTYNAAQTVSITAEEGATIHYTLNGNDPTDKSDVYSSALTISETTTLKAIAVKDGLSSAITTATYTIKLPLTTIDQIFAKAKEVDGTATAVEITMGGWTVSGANDKNVFVTDGTKGFIIYKSDGGHGFNVGDVLSGTVACKVQLFKGSAELTELTSTTSGLTVTTGGTVTPVTLDAAGITALTGVNTGSVIKINGTCTLENSKYYVAGVQLYNTLYEFQTLEPSAEYNVTGVYQLYIATKEILPRQEADIEKIESLPTATISIADITMEVEETKTITATIYPAAAADAVVYSTTSSCISISGNTITSVTEGTATVTATIANADGEYYGTTKDFTVTVTPKSTKDKVVILAEYDGQWYAMMAQYVSGKTSHLAALPVSYVGGKLYNIADADKTLIEWDRAVVDGKATFSNNSKYLTGKSDKTDLTLAATSCDWTISGESYLIGERTFFYNAENNWFRNFKIENVDAKNYSGMPVVTAPVYVNLNTASVKTVENAYFSVAAGKYVQFSTGNLQYEVGTNTWSFASEQYEVIGDEAYTGSNNTNYGMNVPGYTGKLDLFGWSSDGKFGVNPSNTDAHYGYAGSDFVDWGELVNETGWYTLTKEEMNYILNRKKDGKKLWALATVCGMNGLILLPDNWDTSITLDYGYVPANFNYTKNQINDAAWQTLENAGAVFLPEGGTRVGGHGNKDQGGGPNEFDAHDDYFHVDNVGEMGYYWLNTQDTRTGYEKCASYLILPGWSDNGTPNDESDDKAHAPQVWSREKRRGNSVRLVKEVKPDYTREGQGAGVYGTVCYPENIVLVDGATLYEVAGKEGNKVIFDEVTTPVAGMPYIFIADQEVIYFFCGTDEALLAGNHNSLQGTFTQIDPAEDNILVDNYMLVNNIIKKCGINCGLKENRAYFVADDLENSLGAPAASQAPGRRRISLDVQSENTTTDLENILNGENTTIKVIENGQLIIIRNGEKFNAQGQKL